MIWKRGSLVWFALVGCSETGLSTRAPSEGAPDEDTEVASDDLDPDSDTTVDVDTDGPDLDTEDLDFDTEASDVDTEAPDPDTDAPDVDTDPPDVDTDAPDVDTDAPDVDTDPPDVDTDAPDVSAPCPGGIDPYGPPVITPYFPGDYGGFQSRPGNGTQVMITATFPCTASQVDITINDPDFPENYAIAYDINGVELDRVTFIGDGMPGFLTRDTQTVYGPGIARVELIPDPLDYVGYLFVVYQ